MNLAYIAAESATYPKKIEVGVTTVYLRRNIVEVQRTNFMDKTGEPQTIFVYEEAQITKDAALQMLVEERASEQANEDSILIDHEYRLVLLELGMEGGGKDAV